MKTLSPSATRMVCAGVLLVTVAAYAAEPERPEGKATSKLDTTAIEKAIGKAGDMKNDVYKISLPRKDLSVTVKEVKVKPGLALGSWVAFTDGGGKAVMDGDLVLTEDEVGPVSERLRKEGIEITALHNHLIGEIPRVMFLHVAGSGDAADLAKHVKAALSLTATPMEPSAKTAGGLSERVSPRKRHSTPNPSRRNWAIKETSRTEFYRSLSLDRSRSKWQAPRFRPAWEWRPR